MKPRFYSKEIIGGLTLILTPFFGAILFAYNLREIGKGKVAPLVILVGMFWTLLFKKATAEFLKADLFQFFLSNSIGSAILTFVLWDHFFHNYPYYDKKKVWKPLFVFVGIGIALILFQVFAFRQ